MHIETRGNGEIGIEQEKNIYSSLKSSLYPGAQDDSIRMVLSYCKAAKIDPMLKAVHLVPMSVKSGRKDNGGRDAYEYRDVVMPGIALYRIQAERSGNYAGISEPEFGPDITENLGGVGVIYPEWCKVTVKKLIQGNLCEFVAKEYWIENYATKGRDSTAPNAMWLKRKKGQLAKCAEAQALRKAFPELIGSQPTAEEMEGKDLIENVNGVYTSLSRHEPKKVNEAIKDKLKANLTSQSYPQTEIIEKPIENLEKVSTETLGKLNFLINLCNVPEKSINKWLKQTNVAELSDLTEDQAKKIIAKLEEEPNHE